MVSEPLPPPYRVTLPAGARSAVVVASPHCGRDYPPAFLRQTRLVTAQLRRGEDAFVGELWAAAPRHGVPLVRARYGRAYLDLNRAPGELDPLMFDGPVAADPATDRVQAGLGVLPRVVAQGVEIYAQRLPALHAAERVAEVHAPYHAVVAGLLAEARRCHGYAVLVDAHSMPAPPTPAVGLPPQIVLGDLHGRACAGTLTAWAAAFFRAAGFRVAVNDPYAGGYTTRAHGSPAWGCHVLQVEVDRALYMDPVRLQPNAGYAVLADVLQAFTGELAAHAGKFGLAALPVAAE